MALVTSSRLTSIDVTDVEKHKSQLRDASYWIMAPVLSPLLFITGRKVNKSPHFSELLCRRRSGVNTNKTHGPSLFCFLWRLHRIFLQSLRENRGGWGWGWGGVRKEKKKEKKKVIVRLRSLRYADTHERSVYLLHLAKFTLLNVTFTSNAYSELGLCSLTHWVRRERREFITLSIFTHKTSGCNFSTHFYTVI